MSYDDESELLEYETEQSADEATLRPVPVEICEPVITVATVAPHVSCRTIVVATGVQDGNLASGVEELMPYDPLRVAALVYALDKAVVLCHSLAQAQTPGNSGSNPANPGGAFLQVGLPGLTLPTTAQMFVAATESSPARVTVIEFRRAP